MEKYFQKIYTIELSQTLYENTKSRYEGNKIQFIQGDSSKVFKTLLPTINDRAVFFLDGHYSSGNTAQGEKDCPLVEEMESINNLFEHDAIIIIDDYRLFGLDSSSGVLYENWSDISRDRLLDTIKDRVIDVYNLASELANDDRLIIHINAKY